MSRVGLPAPGMGKGDGCYDDDDQPFEIDGHVIDNMAVAAGEDVGHVGLANYGCKRSNPCNVNPINSTLGEKTILVGMVGVFF